MRSTWNVPRTAFVVVLGVMFAPSSLFGQIPRKMTYQGLLTTPAGSPVTDGSYDFEFALYDTLSGGISLWSETQAGVSVQRGTFTVMLGSVTPISPNLTKTAYLQITATGGPPGPSYPLTFSPRSELASVPYALAPWGQTGNDISFTAGKVGIGTSVLGSPLVVEGASNWGITEIVGRGMYAEASIGFRPSNLAKGALGTWVLGVNNNSGLPNAFSLYMANGLGAGSQAITVSAPNGYVGIGNNDPASQLHVGSGGPGYPGDLLTVSALSGNQGITVRSGSGATDYAALRLFRDDTEVGSVFVEDNNRFRILNRIAFDGITIDSSGNVGIGTSTPAQKLQVGGSIGLPTSGVIYAGGIRFIHLSGTMNFFAGENAGRLSMPGHNNVGVGYDALSANTSGNYNTATGNLALSSNTIGGANTATGCYSLLLNTSGNFNTAMGFQALYYSTTGRSNTAIGSETLLNNATGSYNSASGRYALYSNSTGTQNTANGYSALSANQANHGNTAVGFKALEGTTASDYNTAVGANAGDTYNNGYNNVFVGANVDVNQTGLFNVIAMGQGTVVSASSTARFGNAATGSYGGWANWTNVSDGRYKKNVRENVPGIEFIKRLRPITYTLDATGLDAFYHKNDSKESQLTVGAKAIHEMALHEKEAIVYTGFVAQEVEAAARQLGYDFSGVDAPKNDNDTYGLRYAEFVVPLVKAVQELDNENKKLTARMHQLEALLKSHSDGK